MTTTSTDAMSVDLTDAAGTAVIELVATEVDRTWSAVEIIDATGCSVMDTLVALARLTNAGLIARPAPGRYRAIAEADPDHVAEWVRRRILGYR